MYPARALPAFFRFALGACVFSFVNAAACRLPKGESPLWGRSRCPACGKTLSPFELIPCLSYLALRGRCRDCGAKISARDFWIELLGGVLSLCCVLRWGGETPRAVLALAVLAVLTAVALIDYDTREIFDRFHVILLGMALAALRVFPETGLVSRLIGCAAVSVPMLGIALLIPGGFGGGDIKLCFALGFLLGWKGILCAFFSAVMLAGLYCGWSLARKKMGWKSQLAFGPYLCAGAAFALFYGNECVDLWLRAAAIPVF